MQPSEKVARSGSGASRTNRTGLTMSVWHRF